MPFIGILRHSARVRPGNHESDHPSALELHTPSQVSDKGLSGADGRPAPQSRSHSAPLRAGGLSSISSDRGKREKTLPAR